MNLHDHDPELILAIADGAVVSDAARGAVAECAECSADLAAQQIALAALHASPPVALTELESARLMRRLDAELGHERSPAPGRAVPVRRRFSWAPAFSIAAILLVLVLVAPAMNLLGGGDDAGQELDLAFSPATTTAVGADEEAADLPSAARMQEAVPEAGATGDTVPRTTVAPAEDDGATLSAGDGDAPLTLDELRAIVGDAGADLESSRDRVADITDLAPSRDAAACISEGVGSRAEIVASYTLGDLTISAVPAEGSDAPAFVYVTVTVHVLEDGTVVLVAHDRATCEPLAAVP